MSDVKSRLYTNGEGYYILDEVGKLHPATTEVINNCHGKCGECDHVLIRSRIGGGCSNPKSPYHRKFVNYKTDYCPHWKRKV